MSSHRETHPQHDGISSAQMRAYWSYLNRDQKLGSAEKRSILESMVNKHIIHIGHTAVVQEVAFVYTIFSLFPLKSVFSMG